MRNPNYGYGSLQNDYVEMGLGGPGLLKHKAQAFLQVGGVFAGYFLADLALPLYNKLVLNTYSHPLTSSAIEIFVVAIFVAIFDICRHFYNAKNEFYLEGDSWIFGQHFWLKCKSIFVPALAFASVISLSNVGLNQVPANIHVLLRASSVIWVLIFSFFLRQERPGIFEILACVALAGGEVCLTLNDRGTSFQEDYTWLAVFINLLSALCTGLTIVTLRGAVVAVRGFPLRMDSIQVLFFKMFMASLLILAPALIYELGIQSHRGGVPNPWSELSKRPNVIGMLAGGAALTAMFQGCLVGLASMARATSVMVIQESVLLPQLLFFGAIAGLLPKGTVSPFTATPLHIVGTCIIPLSAIAYSWLRRRRTTEETIVLSRPVGTRQLDYWQSPGIHEWN